MKAVVTSTGTVASRVLLGEHEIIFDQPHGVPGGQDWGPSPLDVMAVSVAACTHYFAAAFLHGRGLAADGVRVEVETEKDCKPSPRIGRLSIRVVLPPGLEKPELASIERAIRLCPAYGTLIHAPAVELRIETDRSLDEVHLSA